MTYRPNAQTSLTGGILTKTKQKDNSLEIPFQRYTYISKVPLIDEKYD